MRTLMFLTIFVIGYGIGFMFQIDGLDTPKSASMEAVYYESCDNLGGSMELGGCVLPSMYK